jgi:hypothetical protein
MHIIKLLSSTTTLKYLYTPILKSNISNQILLLIPSLIILTPTFSLNLNCHVILQISIYNFSLIHYKNYSNYLPPIPSFLPHSINSKLPSSNFQFLFWIAQEALRGVLYLGQHIVDFFQGH